VDDLSQELSPREVADLLREADVQLVDVREGFEHEAGRIADDVHIELDRLSEQAGSLDRERPIVFYCRTGSRSEMATHAFAAAGYRAHNLTGGLKAWVADGLPIEPADGRVA
jgi:rhodanese-related sulfurtransferase